MVDISSFLSLLGNIPKVLEEIDKLLKGTRGKKRMLLLELKQNVATIELYSKNQAPIDKVIGNLRIEKVEDAFDKGFKFNSFNNDRVTKKETGGVAFYQAYVGWTTEQLFENIYLKIVELKDIVRMDTNNPNIRKNVRLLNVLKLIKLLLVHISKK
jgi:hypothetical protein